MPLQINIRHVKDRDVQLRGELPVAELDLQNDDDLVRTRLPLHYDLTARMVGDAILAQGRLELTLDCECARCLKPFQHRIALDPWVAHLPLDGPEKAAVKDDLADLTPYVREDILLELPQHPLCQPDCAGAPDRAPDNKTKSASPAAGSPAWAELNKLKF